MFPWVSVMGCPGKRINNDKVQKQANVYQDIQYTPEYLCRSTGCMPCGVQGMCCVPVSDWPDSFTGMLLWRGELATCRESHRANAGTLHQLEHTAGSNTQYKGLGGRRRFAPGLYPQCVWRLREHRHMGTVHHRRGRAGTHQ